MDQQALYQKVLSQIQAEQQRQIAIRRFWISLTFGLAILGAMVPVASSLGKTLATSGFGQYCALLFSDFGVVINHWQDFGLSLLESLPVINIIGFLAITLSLLLTLKFIVKYSKTILKYGKA